MNKLSSQGFPPRQPDGRNPRNDPHPVGVDVEAESLWRRLGRVERLELEVESAEPPPFLHGTGYVLVTRTGDRQLGFEESGRWAEPGGVPVTFSNRYQWTLEPSGSIRIAHLRRGRDRSVELVRIGLQADGTWVSRAPHRCGADEYSALLDPRGEPILLSWRIRGPAKDQHISIAYGMPAATPSGSRSRHEGTGSGR